VRDADRVIGLIEAAEKGPARLVINRIKPELVRRGEMMDVPQIVELLAIDVIGIVPEDTTILAAANLGQPVALSDNGTQAAKAFHNIARRLLGEDVPFLAVHEPSLWRRFFGSRRTKGD